ncbi:MAG: phosphoribosylformylglycinamidine cyclo-ligase [Planctomycetota bacterium]
MTDSLTYRAAGVDIDAGDDFVSRLRTIAESTHGPAVVAAPGGFAGLFRSPASNGGASGVLLVACTDGVGTKLRVAFLANRHDTVGIDLVAMNVNDCIVTGARPLFFLDYIGVGKLDVEVALEIMKGLGAGCRDAQCALLGGETAEMPESYPAGEYDLAGFCVGAVNEDRLIDGRARVKAGDVIIGLASSGLHSNGYSLVRKALFDRAGYALDVVLPELGRPLVDAVMEPTRIYVRSIMALLDDAAIAPGVHGMAHITGGGLPGNVPRVLPDNCVAEIDRGSWTEPAIFDVVRKAGNVDDAEMWKVFNRGIGYVVVCAPEVCDAALANLRASGETANVIGRIVAGSGGPDGEVIIR